MISALVRFAVHCSLLRSTGVWSSHVEQQYFGL
jgi:hypothetical protein